MIRQETIEISCPTDFTPRIYFERGFVADPAALFEALRGKVVWDERLKARKTACFGVSYDYSGMTYPRTDMLDDLVPLCEAIERTLGFHPNNCLLNDYPDGLSSMGFHSDSSMELHAGTGVAIVSLGAERVIVFRHKREKNREASYPLPSGSLLYMPQEIQAEWKHAIPKQPGAGERISLTFRSIIEV